MVKAFRVSRWSSQGGIEYVSRKSDRNRGRRTPQPVVYGLQKRKPNRIRRRLALFGCIFLGMLVPNLLGSVAYAYGSCSKHGFSNHSVSTACLWGVVQFADAVTMPNAAITGFDPSPGTIENTGYHANDTLWAYSGSPCNLWVEIGVTRGYNYRDKYGYYYAWRNANGYGEQFVRTASADGSRHNYEIYYGGSYQGYGTYGAMLDGSVVGTFLWLGFGTCVGQTGVETFPDPTNYCCFHVATFDNTPMSWLDTSGNWHGGWNTSQWVIDDPCGNGYSPPNCLNGTFYGASHWAANKP